MEGTVIFLFETEWNSRLYVNRNNLGNTEQQSRTASFLQNKRKPRIYLNLEFNTEREINKHLIRQDMTRTELR